MIVPTTAILGALLHAQLLTPPPRIPLPKAAAHVTRAVARFAIITQPSRADGPAEVTKYFRFGLSPRGAQSLILSAKGNALLRGRYNVSVEDLKAILG